MADLGELDRSGSVKIAGSDSTGLEDNYMQVDTNGSAQFQLFNSAGSASNYNFGTVGAATLRVAAQLGNATGAADFGAGNTTAQTLRVVVASNQTVINVEDVWNVAAVNGNVAVSTTPVRVKVGASELVNRKVFYIQPQDGHVWLGASNAVSTVIGNANVGTKVFKNQAFPMIFTDNVQMWMVSAGGTVNVTVTEGS